MIASTFVKKTNKKSIIHLWWNKPIKNIQTFRKLNIKIYQHLLHLHFFLHYPIYLNVFMTTKELLRLDRVRQVYEVPNNIYVA